MINYIEGDIFPHILADTSGQKIVLPHVCNCLKGFGSGFVVPLAKHFPKVREEFLKIEKYSLGYTQFVEVSENIVVANMICQTLGGPRPLFYNHLVNCMEKVAEFTALHTTYNDTKIMAPMFGSELAGGHWPFIAELIKDCWTNRAIDTTIFYLPHNKPQGI